MSNTVNNTDARHKECAKPRTDNATENGWQAGVAVTELTSESVMKSASVNLARSCGSRFVIRVAVDSTS